MLLEKNAKIKILENENRELCKQITKLQISNKQLRVNLKILQLKKYAILNELGKQSSENIDNLKNAIKTILQMSIY